MTQNKTFLLSPARTNGRRAASLFNPASKSSLARRLLAGETVPLGEIFSFCSGLYFRGKLTYARHFSRGPVRVITSNQGLVDPDRLFSLAEIASMSEVDLDPGNPSYVRPLEIDLIALSRDSGAEVVFLGSLASPKYVKFLRACLGEKVRVPAVFPGLGDMARGAALLNAVRLNRELDYLPLGQQERRQAAPPSAPSSGRESARPWR